MSTRVSPLFLLLLVVSVAGGVLVSPATYHGLIARSSALVTLGFVLLVLGGWAVSLCLHEFGHAAVAYRGGDLSVRNKGYLTLDIRRYTDPVLSIIFPLVFLLLGGIPLPGGAVWINHGAIPKRGVRSLVSLAGPITNLVLGMALTFVVTLLPPTNVGLICAFSCLAYFQIIAFVLNILPIPGLDGFGVIEPFLSRGARAFAAQVRPWAPMALFVLIIGVPGVSRVFFDAGSALFQLVGGIPQAADIGRYELQFWSH